MRRQKGQQWETLQSKCNSVRRARRAPNPYLQVKGFLFPPLTMCTSTVIVTDKPREIRATVHGIAIKRTFTTCLHTPFTEVPGRGAVRRPFTGGTNDHTATPGVTI